MLIDHHRVVTDGLKAVIDHECDLEVCGAADSLIGAVEAIGRLKPDLVVLELSLKRRSGLELLRDMRTQHPKLKTLVLSMHDETVYAMRAFRLGARGYVMKDETTDTLLVAIRNVLNGHTYLSPRMQKRAVQSLLSRSDAKPNPLETLTDRELEVFRMLGQGKGTQDIAQILCLGVKTIQSHRLHIKEKLQLESWGDVVKKAILFEQHPRID